LCHESQQPQGRAQRRHPAIRLTHSEVAAHVHLGHDSSRPIDSPMNVVVAYRVIVCAILTALWPKFAPPALAQDKQSFSLHRDGFSGHSVLVDTDQRWQDNAEGERLRGFYDPPRQLRGANSVHAESDDRSVGILAEAWCGVRRLRLVVLAQQGRNLGAERRPGIARCGLGTVRPVTE
jgi:hypothetical protein